MFVIVDVVYVGRTPTIGMRSTLVPVMRHALAPRSGPSFGGATTKRRQGGYHWQGGGVGLSLMGVVLSIRGAG